MLPAARQEDRPRTGQCWTGESRMCYSLEYAPQRMRRVMSLSQQLRASVAPQRFQREGAEPEDHQCVGTYDLRSEDGGFAYSVGKITIFPVSVPALRSVLSS